jgi:hypothetical protein
MGKKRIAVLTSILAAAVLLIALLLIFVKWDVPAANSGIAESYGGYYPHYAMCPTVEKMVEHSSYITTGNVIKVNRPYKIENVMGSGNKIYWVTASVEVKVDNVIKGSFGDKDTITVEYEIGMGNGDAVKRDERARGKDLYLGERVLLFLYENEGSYMLINPYQGAIPIPLNAIDKVSGDELVYVDRESIPIFKNNERLKDVIAELKKYIK